RGGGDAQVRRVLAAVEVDREAVGREDLAERDRRGRPFDRLHEDVVDAESADRLAYPLSEGVGPDGGDHGGAQAVPGRGDRDVGRAAAEELAEGLDVDQAHTGLQRIDVDAAASHRDQVEQRTSRAGASDTMAYCHDIWMSAMFSVCPSSNSEGPSGHASGFSQDFTSYTCHDILAVTSSPLWTCRRVCIMVRNRSRGVVAVLAAGALALAGCGQSSGDGGEDGAIELTITQNAIAGGKNAAAADHIANWVIPKFEEAQKAQGKNVTVKFIPSGVDDEQYKTKLSLDLKSGKGADVMDIDGIWAGEFAEAGYIKPLS